MAEAAREAAAAGAKDCLWIVKTITRGGSIKAASTKKKKEIQFIPFTSNLMVFDFNPTLRKKETLKEIIALNY